MDNNSILPNLPKCSMEFPIRRITISITEHHAKLFNVAYVSLRSD